MEARTAIMVVWAEQAITRATKKKSAECRPAIVRFEAVE